MISSRKPATRLSRWFPIGLFSILAFSIALRFWGLSRFNTLVFDEVYFAKFGYNYLTHTPFFDAHPPLGKYFIALGIWLKGFNPFGYRWVNALAGSLIPLVIAGIAYQLSYRRSYALIAGLLAATDGLLLVESRYALINVYLLILGLLGQWCFLLALDAQANRRRWLWLTLSGISFGGTIAVKWNGLGFLLGIYLTWLCAWSVKTFFQLTRRSLNPERPLAPTLFQKMRRLSLAQLLYLPAMSAAVYCLVWIPHLQLNPTPEFWDLQKQMLTYHGRIGSGPNVHPYCSAWYTWPWMIRPVDYFYQTALNSSAGPLPVVGPPLPPSTAKVIYDVHAIGNPALWWLSTAAIITLVSMLAQRLWSWVTVRSIISHPSQPYLARDADFEVPVYLLLNYAANFLPWASVSRCTFIYHYMPAFVFSLLAIAWLVDRWLQSNRWEFRSLGLTAIFLTLASLVFWLPIYLGLPLSPEGFQARMWFRSWI